MRFNLISLYCSLALQKNCRDQSWMEKSTPGMVRYMLGQVRAPCSISFESRPVSAVVEGVSKVVSVYYPVQIRSQVGLILA